EVDQRVRIAHRQHFEKHYIHKVECGHIHADAECQNSDRGESQPWRLFQQACPKAHILKQPIQPRPTPGFARLLREESWIPEVLAAIRRHHLSMRLHVLLQLTLQPSPVEEVMNPSKKSVHKSAP